jgi:type I restriction enzyme R subunit
MERDEVEDPFIRQLESMGWTHIRGKDLVADKERDYTDVLLKNRLARAIRKINRLDGSDAEWIDPEDRDGHAARAIAMLETLKYCEALPGNCAVSMDLEVDHRLVG